MPDLSVILCTWNNCRRLELTLGSIARCRIPDRLEWELVLVDNNCSDETPGVVQSAREQLPLIAVEETRQGLSRARNRGLLAASGRLMIFTDDDISPSPDWIATYWAAYQAHPEEFYFGGPLTPDYETAPPEPDLLPLAALPIAGLDWGPRARALEPHERFLGANWACPAEALQTAGGFDVNLGLDASLGRRRVGEEWDLMERLRGQGLVPWYLPEAHVAHFVPTFKCHLGYLAENWEAHGYVIGLDAVVNTPFIRARPHLETGCRDHRPRIAGAPWRTYAQAIQNVLGYLLARMRGERGVQSYASWRFYRGVIRGFRDRRRPRDPDRERRTAP